MDENIQLLISLLLRIDYDDTIDIINGYYLPEHPLVNAAIFMANEYLFGDDGHIIRKNIDEVIRNGFPIYAGEMDRFGWVTGIIELSGGIIIFG